MKHSIIKICFIIGCVTMLVCQLGFVGMIVMALSKFLGMF